MTDEQDNEQTVLMAPPQSERWLTNADIENRHAYHPPSNDDVRRLHELVREETVVLALWMNDALPECAEKTTALNKVRDAMMYANAAIACHGNKKE